MTVPTLAAAGRWLYLAAATALAIVALGAALELASTLNRLWTGFPGPLGSYGLAIVAAVVLPSVVGLIAVIRLPARWAIVVAAAALIATRFAALLLVEPSLVRDQSAYDSLARGVFAGECCFGVRPMGYPILLAVAYELGLSGKVVNFLFALGAGPMLFVLGRRLAGERAGALAVYLYAAAPALVLYSGVLMTETVYATLVLAALAAATVTARPAASAGAGLILGLAQYVRAVGVYLAPALLLPALRRRAWRALALFLAALAIALLPVLLATGGVSTESVGGLSVMMGTNQQHDGRYNQEDVALYSTWGPDRERLAMQEAVRRIVSDPVGFAALAVRKSHIMWTQEYYGVVFAMADAGLPERDRAPARLVSQLAYVVILIGAAATAWRVRRVPSDVVVVILAIFLIAVGLHTLAEVQHRFHAYLVPLFAVLAAASLAPRGEPESRGGHRDARPPAR